jgi:hypothetical protein
MVMNSILKDVMKTFRVPEKHVGMFAYGSLMSRELHARFSDTDYTGPFLPAHIWGYRRSWTFAWPCDIPFPDADGNCYREYIIEGVDRIYPKHLHFLNIREDPNSRLNGALFLVPEDALPVYDAYELGYERIDIGESLTDHLIEGGPVFAYRALPFFDKQPVPDPNRNIVDKSYLKRIRETLAYWGSTFEKAYQKSTLAVDPGIVREVHSEFWNDPPMEKFEKFRERYNHQGG